MQALEVKIDKQLEEAERAQRNIYMQLVPEDLPKVSPKQVVHPHDPSELLSSPQQWFDQIVPDAVTRHLSKCASMPLLGVSRAALAWAPPHYRAEQNACRPCRMRAQHSVDALHRLVPFLGSVHVMARSSTSALIRVWQRALCCRRIAPIAAMQTRPRQHGQCHSMFVIDSAARKQFTCRLRLRGTCAGDTMWGL